MKKLLMAAVVGATMGLFAQEPEAAFEESSDSGFSFEASVDIMSDYMWRGMILNDNPCWQPSFTISYDTEDFGGVYFNYWMSFDLTHKRNKLGGNSRRFGGIQEQDFTLAYTKSFGDFDFELGVCLYDFPYSGPNHCAGTFYPDVFASVKYNNEFVTPSAEVYWTCTTTHDNDPSIAYFRLAAEHEFEVFEGLTVTPKASLGIGDGAYVKSGEVERGAHTEMADQTLTLAAEYQITEWWSIGANVNYTWIVSHTLRQNRYMTAGEDSRHQLVWGGVGMTFNF